MRYFLEVAKYGNFSAAAESLHLTQPTLSRQILDLEDELGCRLLTRGKRKTILTDAGQYLLLRAREILELTEKTKTALRESQDIGGDVYIAGGESPAMGIVARSIKRTREVYPRIRFHIFSGNAEAVSHRLDHGLADFGIFLSPANLEAYEYISCPDSDLWGVLARNDSPIARLQYVTAADLAGIDLICSSQDMVGNAIGGWLGGGFDKLNIVATYTLLYNAALMVKEGIGCAICLGGIVNTSPPSEICFRPLHPLLKVGMDVAWKKNQAFTRSAEVFRETLRQDILEANFAHLEK